MKVKLVLLLLSVGVSSMAQNVTFTKVWEKVYGGIEIEVLGDRNCLFLDRDSNIVLVGTAVSSVSGNKISPNCAGSIPMEADVWIFKLDQSGNKIFEQSYGSSNSEGAQCASYDHDGSIVLAGRSDSPIECYKSQNRFSSNPDIWLIKVDSQGGKLWDKRFGTTNTDWITNINKTPDHGYIVTGACGGFTSQGNILSSTNGQQDITLIKIDSNGLKQWDKLYGGIGTEIGSLSITKDLHYFIAGGTTSWLPGGDISSTNIGGNNVTASDGWVLKIDTNGTILWEQRYGCQNDDALGLGFEDLRGDYVVVGNVIGNCIGGNVIDTLDRGGVDIWLVKLDPTTGAIKYDKRIGGNGLDVCTQIIETSDGGYLLACKSNSDAGFEKSEPRIVPANPNLYQLWEDFWIVKMDSMFNVQWDKTIGGDNQEISPCVLLLNDSTFILAGSSGSDISGDKTLAIFDTVGPTNARSDIWVMKFTASSITGINEIALPQFSIYPNPVTDMLYVSPKKQLSANALVAIIDLQGRVIREEKLSQNNGAVIPLDVSSLARGVYLVKLNGQVQRFVKL